MVKSQFIYQVYISMTVGVSLILRSRETSNKPLTNRYIFLLSSNTRKKTQESNITRNTHSISFSLTL